MRNLHDNGLDWFSCDRELLFDDKRIINFEDNKQIEEWLKEIDYWKSENIAKYICERNVGEFLRRTASKDENMFFGFEDGKLATVAVVEGQKQMYEFVEFTNYIAECKSLGIDSKPDHLNMYQAMRALINTTGENNTVIQFLVVNPNMQQRGIGSRAVKAVVDNVSFFSGNENNNVAQSLIHYQNVASQRIFRKNDFYPVSIESQKNLALEPEDKKVVTTVYDNYYHVF